MHQQSATTSKPRYTRQPIIRQVLADLDTPLSTYLKLADGPHTYLLESVQGGEKWGRYSIIGLQCQAIVRVFGNEVVLSKVGQTDKKYQVDDPLAWIANYQQQFIGPEVDGLPRFTGGLVGYFGYDTVRYVEPRLAGSAKHDELNVPDIMLMVSDELVVFDNLSGKLYLIINVDPVDADAQDAAVNRLDELEVKLRAPLQVPVTPGGRQVHESDFVSGFTRQAFMEAVERSKQYIIDGDIMQVVLSQRMSLPFQATPLDLYRALRSLNPSPYMFYLDFKEFHVVGSSPEILVHLEDGEVTVRPIAGTRPRGQTEAEDKALEEDLLSDPKELAEHLMLIDLGRNDVGRIAETGSVKLTEKMVIERYSHVMHIVSNVSGRLLENKSPIDVMRATFPAGTLSGAPKIRAMEIIDELEPVKRGIYGGAIGYLSWSGNMDTAIAIRTAVIKDGILHIQVGAGIVADSVPENEWEETLNKGRAMFRAVSLAESGVQKPVSFEV